MCVAVYAKRGGSSEQGVAKSRAIRVLFERNRQKEYWGLTSIESALKLHKRIVEHVMTR